MRARRSTQIGSTTSSIGQEQSTHGLAPNFGDAEESVIARAQNGVLYEAEAEGTATYMVVLSLRYTKTYESEDFA